MGMWGLWARELQLAQEQQANPTPLSFTARFPAWAWGEFRSRVSELRPCAMADRSGGKHTVWTCPDRLAHPLAMQLPGPLCSSCTMHVLSPRRRLDTWSRGEEGLPCACLECPAEDLLTASSGLPRGSGASIGPLPGAEVQLCTRGL